MHQRISYVLYVEVLSVHPKLIVQGSISLHLDTITLAICRQSYLKSFTSRNSSLYVPSRPLETAYAGVLLLPQN